MRVLVVGDEPLGQAVLVDVLRERRDVELFHVASNGNEALENLKRNLYDVMLLDLHMPGTSGFDLVECLKEWEGRVPSVVFVTAHGERSLAAFAKPAVDYVLRPFSPERMHEALSIAARRSYVEQAARVIKIFPELQALSGASPKIAIKSAGRTLFIDPRDVIAVEAQGDHVLLEVQGGSYLLRHSISAMAEKLKQYGFIRIHRSALVNKSFVEEIRAERTGQHELRVKGGKEYSVTRTYKSILKSFPQP